MLLKLLIELMNAFKGLTYGIDTKKMLPSIMIYYLGIGNIFCIFNRNFNKDKSFALLLLTHYKPRIRGNSNPYYLIIDIAIGKETMFWVIAIISQAIETSVDKLIYCHLKKPKPRFSTCSGRYKSTRRGLYYHRGCGHTLYEIFLSCFPGFFGLGQCLRITQPEGIVQPS